MQTTLAQFNETQSTDAFALQNSKLLKVSLNQVTIQAKLGSMVAYQGEVSFEHAGSGGLGRMLKKAVSGEGTSLMRMNGTGEVFLADQAQDIHLIYLENDTITVNGPNLLAFDAGIDWDIHRLSGGAAGAMAGGLFNMHLSGTGWVAILSDGPPVLLNVAQAPTFADALGAAPRHPFLNRLTHLRPADKVRALLFLPTKGSARCRRPSRSSTRPSRRTPSRCRTPSC